jgi:hypothetical protein
MKSAKPPLAIVAFSAGFLGVIVSLVVLGLGVMFFFLGQYRHVVTSALLIATFIGVAAIIVDLGVILRSFREWSWRNVLMVGLTVVNVALTGVLVFLFRYFSQPIAGTGSP